MDLEFYAPFAHLPGRLEWCRIRSPTHGIFDTCIVIGDSTSEPVTVYVHDEAGARFMADRFPESSAIRVVEPALRMRESLDGLRLHCSLRAQDGPLRRAEMAFIAERAVPRQVPYGSARVWGSRYRCEGIDLELDAKVHGLLQWEDGSEPLQGEPGILTVGSMGRLEAD